MSSFVSLLDADFWLDTRPDSGLSENCGAVAAFCIQYAEWCGGGREYAHANDEE